MACRCFEIMSGFCSRALASCMTRSGSPVASSAISCHRMVFPKTNESGSSGIRGVALGEAAEGWEMERSMTGGRRLDDGMPSLEIKNKHHKRVLQRNKNE